jgi:hypothetical protein
LGFAIPGQVPPIRISLDGGAPIDVLNVDPAAVPGGSANFFGVISDTPFTTVRLINPPGTAGDAVGVDDITIGQKAVAAVPEPSSLTLFGLGGLGLLGYGWQRRKRLLSHRIAS